MGRSSEWSAEEDASGGFEIYTPTGKFTGYAYSEADVVAKIRKALKRMGEPIRGTAVQLQLHDRSTRSITT